MIWLWLAFIAAVVGLLLADLTLVHRNAKTVTARSALRWVAFFVVLALLFNFAVYFIYANDWLGFGAGFKDHARRAEAQQLVLAGRLTPAESESWQPAEGGPAAEAINSPGRTAAVQFLTGWLTEYSLSVDNIFVIALIFSHFRVRPEHQRRVLFWGILGALVMRGLMILAGTALIDRFHWVLYLLGAFLVFTAFRLALSRGDDERDLETSRVIRWTRRLLPLSTAYDGPKFLTRLADGRRAATPLLLVLIIVEVTDLVFALDSIPAILGITTDPFLVFTSNVFAILGLRSLFFALAGMMDRFHFLKYSLAAILGFVGLKMLLEMPFIDISISSFVSLAVIVLALAAGVGASLIPPRSPTGPPSADDAQEAIAAARRTLRKVLILIAGTIIIVFGIAIAPLPGPGPTILVPIGLALLATEFVWARRILDRLKSGAFSLGGRADALVARTGVWIIPAITVIYWAGAIGLLAGLLHLRWYTIAAIAGSPFIPFSIWAVSYLGSRRTRAGAAPGASASAPDEGVRGVPDSSPEP